MFTESLAESDESIAISELRWNSDFADIILKAIRELNYNVSNINSELYSTGIYFMQALLLYTVILLTLMAFIFLGFMKVQLTMENGKRWSSDKVLYRKAHRTLTILTHARASKVSLPKNVFFFIV